MISVKGQASPDAPQCSDIKLFFYSMKDFQTYLSVAPVVATIWFAFTAGILIELNRFFPDPLVFTL